jgi:L-lactate dehydrogenase complex protein LldG
MSTSNKESILNRIRQNKPNPVILKESNFGNLPATVLQLIATLKAIKTEAVLIPDLNAVQEEIQQLQQEGKVVLSVIDNLIETEQEQLSKKSAADLANLDYAFIKGQYAVTENGAIWVSDKNIYNRLIPFICKHLVIVIDAAHILTDMHQAYAAINIREDGYGVFIAGPSKTADIEQSLVIGAHGPLSLKVYIIQKES